MTLENRQARAIQTTPSSYELRPLIWQNISREQWQSPRWQQQNVLTQFDEISRAMYPLELTEDEKSAIERANSDFSTRLSPHWLALMCADSTEALRRQSLPTMTEWDPLIQAHKTPQSVTPSKALVDPLGERIHSACTGLTHRYPDRVLLYATPHCAMHCRFCTRRRKVGDPNSALYKDELELAIQYIRKNNQVRDCLISGGDPLTLPLSRLKYLLEALRSIPHLDVIRLCTRAPVTMPQLITTEHLALLKKFAPIYLNTHFNHPAEASIEAATALRQLNAAGAILGNQTVLLRGINDDAGILEKLFRWLLRHACRPYYLFQVDMGRGMQHFRTPIQRGIDLIDELRGRLSGLAIPHFAVDLPHGYGKITLTPDYQINREGRCIFFRNHTGTIVPYEDVD